MQKLKPVVEGAGVGRQQRGQRERGEGSSEVFGCWVTQLRSRHAR